MISRKTFITLITSYTERKIKSVTWPLMSFPASFRSANFRTVCICVCVCVCVCGGGGGHMSHRRQGGGKSVKISVVQQGHWKCKNERRCIKHSNLPPIWCGRNVCFSHYWCVYVHVCVWGGASSWLPEWGRSFSSTSCSKPGWNSNIHTGHV